MEIIHFPRLRNKELQTVGENSLQICNGIPEVKPAYDKASSTLSTFVKGMQKDKNVGQSKKSYDRKRDTYTSAFIYNVKYEMSYEHNVEDTALVTALNNIIGKYAGIARLPYNEQTAATDNMLDEVQVVLSGNESLPHLSRWIPLIDDANNEFKAVSSDYIKSSVDLKETDAASLIAPQLAEDLENLFTLMYAHAKIGSNANVISAYKELEVLIDSVN
ncbi:DUF6261 family protein [Carboxylicivirga marina]|uniref:DUF6261 family protein n=1 Tax=Carboxylicivirga marina TaxID=2800988 RepID=UPI0025962B9C|nr:DUF6261 family protein [uncultured Carboxylicivirga sp.]